MGTDSELRFALLDFLNNPYTHAAFVDAAKGLPEEFYNVKPPGASYSFWDMLEHIRISQWDMVDFMTNSNYKEMEWPKEYWPKPGEKADKEKWERSVEQFQKDEEKMRKIIQDPSFDLLVRIPHGSGQTVFREILQIIDHNGYHIGQFVYMRKSIGQWNPQ